MENVIQQSVLTWLKNNLFTPANVHFLQLQTFSFSLMFRFPIIFSRSCSFRNFSCKIEKRITVSIIPELRKKGSNLNHPNSLYNKSLWRRANSWDKSPRRVLRGGPALISQIRHRMATNEKRAKANNVSKNLSTISVFFIALTQGYVKTSSSLSYSKSSISTSSWYTVIVGLIKGFQG